MRAPRTVRELLRHPAAWLSLGLGAAALLWLVSWLVLFGTEPQPDEGLGAHVFQLLMVGQLAAIVVFAASWIPREPRAAWRLLALDLLVAVAALLPVWYFRL